MSAPVSPETMGKMVARRRVAYGGQLGKQPGEAGPYHVYDAGGKRIAQFSRVQRAMQFVNEQATLQPHNKRNEPLGPRTSPGVIVVRGQKLIHVVQGLDMRTKEAKPVKALLEHLGIAPDSKIAGQE